MKRWSAADALSLGVITLAAAVTAGIYDRLPTSMPTHFDAHGVANGWMSRPVGAWLPLGVALFTWLALRVAPVAFPRRWRSRMNESHLALVAFLSTASIVGLHLVSLRAGILRSTTLPAGVGALFGVFLLILSLVLPRVRRNPIVGIRTPWALSSDENWARTHHFAGYVFFAGGLVAIAASLEGALATAISAIVVSAVVPALYSFVLFRRTRQ